MNKVEYLRLALKDGLAIKLDWIVSVFSLVRANEPDLKTAYAFQLFSMPWGYGFFNNGEIVKIEGVDNKTPLFRFDDRITIDPTWFVNVPEKTETSVGNALVNALCIVPVAQSRIPFKVGRHSMSFYEQYMADRLDDEPTEGKKKDPDKFYPSDLTELQNRFQYLEEIAYLCNYSATPKAIRKPDGIDEFKAKLAAEYGDQLKDPVKMAEFKAKLREFDDNWLKDDPGYNKFLKGKIKNIAREKMFLALGLGLKMDSNEPNKPIVNSLSDGLPLDPESQAAWINDSRASSFSRGTETINGGVAAKIIIRAISNYRIIETDCGTKFGKVRRYNEKNISKLVGRTILLNGKNKLIEDIAEANTYLGRAITVRSPQYCVLGKKGGTEDVCGICAGKRLIPFDQGMIIPATELSSIILTAALKAMHGKTLSTVQINWDVELT